MTNVTSMEHAVPRDHDFPWEHLFPGRMYDPRFGRNTRCRVSRPKQCNIEVKKRIQEVFKETWMRAKGRMKINKDSFDQRTEKE